MYNMRNKKESEFITLYNNLQSSGVKNSFFLYKHFTTSFIDYQIWSHIIQILDKLLLGIFHFNSITNSINTFFSSSLKATSLHLPGFHQNECWCLSTNQSNKSVKFLFLFQSYQNPHAPISNYQHAKIGWTTQLEAYH